MVYIKKEKENWYLYESIREGNQVKKKYLGRASLWQIIWYRLKGAIKRWENREEK